MDGVSPVHPVRPGFTAFLSPFCLGGSAPKAVRCRAVLHHPPGITLGILGKSGTSGMGQMGAGVGDTLCSAPACLGHYMHFDTSMLGARGTSALLESPPLPAATDSCLRFWYHMDIPEQLCEHGKGREEVPSLGLMYGSGGLSLPQLWTMNTLLQFQLGSGDGPFPLGGVMPVEDSMAGRARWLLWARGSW